jgi:hypothetical protein
MTAKPTGGEAAVSDTIAGELLALGMAGVLVQMAKLGQIIEVRCEMPQCFCPRGRKYFDARSVPLTKWAPSPDHHPWLKMHGGHLTPDNVRLAHVLCNNRDFGWRRKINVMLAKKMSLDEIAEKLNHQGIPPAPGRNKWSAAMVREAFVS